MEDQKILSMIQSLTLQEKAALCSGFDAWTTKANTQKGIPALRMADGPHGLRMEDRENEQQHGGHSKPATCFPTAVTVASSWSPELARQMGQAIAEECQGYGVHMLLGPGVNIKRSPLGGRNFEYYSEDPLLSGKMAAGFISGVQDKGVATSLKHFAVNNQEKKRMSISAAVDDRALFDIYLKPFEIAVRDAQPATVMCSYNRVNGTYASENRRLLTDILRLRFGFTGAVISDWGAVNDRAQGILAGLDLEMPSSGGVNDYAIVEAVKQGTLPEDALDTVCWNLLRLIFEYTEKADTTGQPIDFEAHHQLAAQVLEKSAVLLKNDGMLPLQAGVKIAVIGEMAEKPRFQGGGSSVINPKNLVSFLAALDNAGQPYQYAPGYHVAETNEALLAAAAGTAAQADTVVLFLGLPDAYESEGYDREHLSLPPCHLQLLAAVQQANPNLCVVLCCGSPVETPWLPDARALLCLHLGGEALGEGAYRLLYGHSNPSGKLTESWPLSLADTPCYHYFPLGPREVTYNESIYVGYRYYDTVKSEVRFPFGYGLSYTTFAYSNLHISGDKLAAGQPLDVRFTVTNTGEVDGEEIVQLYLARLSSVAPQPAHELKAFARVALKAGESREVNLHLAYPDFAFYDTTSQISVVETGTYEIQAGANSRDLPLKAALHVEGVTLSGRAAPAERFYANIQDNTFPAETFAERYKGSLLGNTAPKQGEYTMATTLGEMQESRWGRRILRLVKSVSGKFIRFSPDPEANRRASDALAEDLPLKNIVLQTNGRVSPAAARALLSLCNGEGGFWRLIAQLLKRRPY